jgi:RHS repeat-associated protein
LINRWLNPDSCDATMTGYERKWAREFRYDGDRQRYLSRELDPVTLYPVCQSGSLTDYAGDTPMVDHDPSTTPPADTFSYVPGVAEIDLSSPPAATAHYLHTDHLGSTWFKSDAPALGNPVPTRQVIRSAFGEAVFVHSGPESRYGYAGVWGYQQHDYDNGGQGDGKPDTVVNTTATDGFPFLHVGARYYDPSTGRFLQRDPIGLRGGMNVYAYTSNDPLINVDPSGRYSLEEGVAGVIFGLIGYAIAGPIGAAVGGLGNGWEEGDASYAWTMTCHLQWEIGWAMAEPMFELMDAMKEWGKTLPPKNCEPLPIQGTWYCFGCRDAGVNPYRPDSEGRAHFHEDKLGPRYRYHY